MGEKGRSLNKSQFCLKTPLGSLTFYMLVKHKMLSLIFFHVDFVYYNSIDFISSHILYLPYIKLCHLHTGIILFLPVAFCSPFILFCSNCSV